MLLITLVSEGHLFFLESFRGSLDEAYAGDLSFADSLQAFGAGLDDPVSVAIGGYFSKALMYLLLNSVLSSYLHLANQTLYCFQFLIILASFLCIIGYLLHLLECPQIKTSGH